MVNLSKFSGLVEFVFESTGKYLLLLYYKTWQQSPRSHLLPRCPAVGQAVGECKDSYYRPFRLRSETGVGLVRAQTLG